MKPRPILHRQKVIKVPEGINRCVRQIHSHYSIKVFQ